ncbi:hypothetical protein HD806DRAFT_527800 [Xylariaceae sp. AK1471]|nr:hypothetical protein HD806DRAFT_527800 [Xylariaceae sp. AK1471]
MKVGRGGDQFRAMKKAFGANKPAKHGGAGQTIAHQMMLRRRPIPIKIYAKRGNATPRARGAAWEAGSSCESGIKSPSASMQAGCTYDPPAWAEMQRSIDSTLSSRTSSLLKVGAPTNYYVALSYVWTTHTLGIQYLWVDAFCIIQDSEEDKAIEIAKIRTIFQQAHITIIAVNASCTRRALTEAHDRLLMLSGVAPSWSWAAVDGEIYTDPFTYAGVVCTVKHCYAEPKWDVNPYGEVTASVPVLDVILRRVVWDPVEGELRSMRSACEVTAAVLGDFWNEMRVIGELDGSASRFVIELFG